MFTHRETWREVSSVETVLKDGVPLVVLHVVTEGGIRKAIVLPRSTAVGFAKALGAEVAPKATRWRPPTA